MQKPKILQNVVFSVLVIAFFFAYKFFMHDG